MPGYPGHQHRHVLSVDFPIFSICAWWNCVRHFGSLYTLHLSSCLPSRTPLISPRRCASRRFAVAVLTATRADRPPHSGSAAESGRFLGFFIFPCAGGRPNMSGTSSCASSPLPPRIYSVPGLFRSPYGKRLTICLGLHSPVPRLRQTDIASSTDNPGAHHYKATRHSADTEAGRLSGAPAARPETRSMAGQPPQGPEAQDCFTTECRPLQQRLGLAGAFLQPHLRLGF